MKMCEKIAWWCYFLAEKNEKVLSSTRRSGTPPIRLYLEKRIELTFLDYIKPMDRAILFCCSITVLEGIAFQSAQTCAPRNEERCM